MKVVEALAVLVDALKEELGKAENMDDFCSMTIMPGNEIPLDLDCGGSGWVRLVSVVPSEAFPSQSARPGNCGYMLAYSVEMAVFRPAPQMRKFANDVTVPSDEENFIAAEQQMADMTAMHAAMRSASQLFPDFLLGSYVPQGPEGGLVGGVWSMTIGLD